jgi:hypothetical protein
MRKGVAQNSSGMCRAHDNATTMILISIRPFALRKILLIAVTLLCLSALCFADSLFMAPRHWSAARLISFE